ncbi:hypothetical protein DXD09_01530 [Ligilactobacillus ruminis]|uniref:Uncharacterized protein n=1 Tax=Ligilactobacillus ruminis TaxID=1623 RepID=A0A8B2Z1Q1_9LACO|nr:hypothetical protein [Ligilactobacillus ruminis]RGK48434.1 hypothetical protein DXD09_01530 [Ligilactobacillus ruminis]
MLLQSLVFFLPIIGYSITDNRVLSILHVTKHLNDSCFSEKTAKSSSRCLFDESAVIGSALHFTRYACDYIRYP